MKRRNSLIKAGIIGAIMSFTLVSAAQHDEFLWDREAIVQSARDHNNPSLWNTGMLEQEIEFVPFLLEMDLPLAITPFPVPDYETNGNGNRQLETVISGKQILGQTLSVGRGAYSEFLFDGIDNDQVYYFTILTVAVNDDAEVMASSRNHPNYIGQGSLNRGVNSRIDWVAFQSADDNAFAIVNGRLFDLKAGRVVLCAPQADGSMRFHQLDHGVFTEQTLEAFINELPSHGAAVEFFGRNGGI